MIRSILAATTGALLFATLYARPALGEDCGKDAQECAAYHLSRQEYAQAIPHLERTLAASPGNVKVMNLLGISLTATGQVEKANLQFKKALGIQPDFYPAEKNLAVNEFNLGNRSEA